MDKTWADAKQIFEGVYDGALYVLASADGKRAVEAYVYDDCLMCDWYVEGAGGVDLGVGNGRYYVLAGTTEYARQRMRLMKSEALTWINDNLFVPEQTPMLEWRNGDWHPREEVHSQTITEFGRSFDPAAIVVSADSVCGPWLPMPQTSGFDMVA